MGLQLIFVVESKRTCKSDWIYIKDTIDYFYQYNYAHTRFTPVYMDGKGKYKNKEKEVSSFISQYAAVSEANQSKVIYCFDCDDYDKKREDADFLSEVKEYCRKKQYEFVWFCKDIEQVYWGKRIENSRKKKESEKFKSGKWIKSVDVHKLNGIQYKENSSNLMKVLDKYLVRK